MINAIPCAVCERFNPDVKDGNFCEAFPDGAGIPDAIITAERDHTHPFPGDNGLRFKAIEQEAVA